MDNKPVYPKDNPEHRKMVMEQFYDRVKKTKWHDEEDLVKKSKVKMAYRPKSTYKPKKKFDYVNLTRIIDGRKITSI